MQTPRLQHPAASPDPERVWGVGGRDADSGADKLIPGAAWTDQQLNKHVNKHTNVKTRGHLTFY